MRFPQLETEVLPPGGNADPNAPRAFGWLLQLSHIFILLLPPFPPPPPPHPPPVPRVKAALRSPGSLKAFGGAVCPPPYRRIFCNADRCAGARALARELAALCAGGAAHRQHDEVDAALRAALPAPLLPLSGLRHHPMLVLQQVADERHRLFASTAA